MTWQNDPAWKFLLRAVCERPDDDQVRLVAADFLEEYDRDGAAERAEFIRVQMELHRWGPTPDHVRDDGTRVVFEPTRKLRERAGDLLLAYRQHSDGARYANCWRWARGDLLAAFSVRTNYLESWRRGWLAVVGPTPWHVVESMGGLLVLACPVEEIHVAGVGWQLDMANSAGRLSRLLFEASAPSKLWPTLLEMRHPLLAYDTRHSCLELPFNLPQEEADGLLAGAVCRWARKQAGILPDVPVPTINNRPPQP